MSIFTRLRDAALAVVEDVRAARAPAAVEPEQPTFLIQTPGLDEAIELAPPKRFARPLTEEEAFQEAKRIAMDYAQKRTGNPNLTWKQTKRLMDEWEKEERLADRERERERARNGGKTIELVTR
ncbi:MAG: hypothetical protein ACREBE_03880 [bacterium]